ncbi:MAG: potassium channel family protein [Chloroflexi bacterium]|nr:potassium channel family protein [Chloroflexota bacterium]
MNIRALFEDADQAHREALLTRMERATELPLLVLAFVMVPLLLGPLLWPLSPAEQDVFLALDTFIWALFAVDLGIKVIVAPRKLEYLRRHWLDALVVAIPFFRPLRLLRLFAYGTRAIIGARRLVNVDFLFVYGLGIVLVAATLLPALEASSQRASIQTFPDALWWAVATVTTVGYGDMVPVTPGGRAVGVVLMLTGVAFYSGVTANLASFLTRGNGGHAGQAHQQDDRLDRLLSEVQALREEVGRLRSAGAGPSGA